MSAFKRFYEAALADVKSKPPSPPRRTDLPDHEKFNQISGAVREARLFLFPTDEVSDEECVLDHAESLAGNTLSEADASIISSIPNRSNDLIENVGLSTKSCVDRNDATNQPSRTIKTYIPTEQRPEKQVVVNFSVRRKPVERRVRNSWIKDPDSDNEYKQIEHEVKELYRLMLRHQLSRKRFSVISHSPEVPSKLKKLQKCTHCGNINESANQRNVPSWIDKGFRPTLRDDLVHVGRHEASLEVAGRELGRFLDDMSIRIEEKLKKLWWSLRTKAQM